MPYEPSPIVEHSDPQMQYSIEQNSFESSRTRSRRPSAVRGDANMPDSTARLAQFHQPIDEAVSSAFSRTETPNHLTPELIAQITKNVIKQLTNTNIDGGNPPPPPVYQQVSSSPPRPSASPSKIHPLSSPHSPTDYPNHGSPPPQAQLGGSQSIPSGFRDAYHNHAQDKSEPSKSHNWDRSSSPLSQTSESGHIRPKGPARLSTSQEETTLEKIWGPLFDENGNPTPRLGQLLRGLAVHIIEDYEPRNSIVITPDKMIKFYEDVKLSEEKYPWFCVFDDGTSAISRMYRELSCQHHLVQEEHDQRPDIPGLTPIGFERWATILIQAHPEEEFERLQKAVLDMPISNPDEKTERFPKEMSRRLFPATGDRQIQGLIEDAICKHAKIDLHKRPRNEGLTEQQSSVDVDPAGIASAHKPSIASDYIPPTSYPRESGMSGEPIPATTLAPSSLERERAPYSNTPVEAIIDDTNPHPPPPPPSQPIERERKPYTAIPGGGKAYDDDVRTAKPKPEAATSNIGRSNSTARPRALSISQNTQRPMEGSRPEIHQHHRAPSDARRRRSPSFSRNTNDSRRSDGELRGAVPPPPAPGSAVEFYEDDPRRPSRDWTDRTRRPAEEDPRLYSDSSSSRARHERGTDPRRSYIHEEDFYRNAGRGQGNGYEPSQPYGGPVYR